MLIVAVFGTEDGDVETRNAGVRKSCWMLVVAGGSHVGRRRQTSWWPMPELSVILRSWIAKQLIAGFEIRVQTLNTKRYLQRLIPGFNGTTIISSVQSKHLEKHCC